MSVGIAAATKEHKPIGRIHRNSGTHVVQAKRNRQRLWTACGIRLDMAWPFDVDDVAAAKLAGNLCGKCWKDRA